jgi:antibiotic biosynthesis monooxygenase
MTGGVVRKWEATMARKDVDRWRETFLSRVYPGMSAIAGFKGIRVLLSRDADPCRMTVLTTWDDMAAVESFAGKDPARTVLPDFMAPFFPDHSPKATFHDDLPLEVN